MSLRHKKRQPEQVSESRARKMLANQCKRNGRLKPGQSSAPFSLGNLRLMAAG